MRRIAVALRWASVAGLLILVGFACGNDTSGTVGEDDAGSDAGGSGGGDTTNGAGGSGGADSGGAGGSGGSATTTTGNATSTTSSTGAGGTGMVVDNPDLAQPCNSDADCGSDLICVTADSNGLSQGGPANGMCTMPCDEETTCEELGPNAVCLTFTESNAYCMPLCGMGDGVQDCAGRSDMVCDVIPAFTGMTCSTTTDCLEGEVCLGDECAFPVPICLSKCHADSDCPDGRFCDPNLGECVDTQPEGLGPAEVCDVDASTDECLGFCADEGADSPRCIQTCSLDIYPACGSDDLDDASAACLFPLYQVGTDLGDAGRCVPLCDCTSDCPEGLLCVSFTTPSFGLDEDELFGRAGLCDFEQPEDIILSCE